MRGRGLEGQIGLGELRRVFEKGDRRRALKLLFDFLLDLFGGGIVECCRFPIC